MTNVAARHGFKIRGQIVVELHVLNLGSVSERVGIFIYHGVIRDEYTICHLMS